MSFARQFSICRGEDDATIAPTALEVQLASLERPGMFGDRQIQQVLTPGRYSFDPTIAPHWKRVDWWELDVTQKRAGRIREPRRACIENVSWQQSDGFDWTVYLPTDSHVISVPIDPADDAGLGYYNCRLIEPDDVISLHHRSVIVNFCYQDEYLEQYVLGKGGGCSIEQHDFAHVDMPLDVRSGLLVIGKIDPADQALELTAFAVKPGQRVYIPAKTIHTNDFLLGTWETLLSSACEFPSAQIKPSTSAASGLVQEHALPPLAFSG